ncbi:MAG: acetate--CoA ligase family protein, partial [Actinobacteria bacterium]|nr:acetate--CoA ligase family protein [Actinomycetota bacterium]
VSSNDVLLWWEQDGVTRLAVLYVESFGNPRKFARTARRVGASMPVLAVQAGRSDLAEALFEQAGVIATRGFGELIETTALLATQPIPAGRTVAVVSNVGSVGRLAADACTSLGLSVHHPHGLTRRRLRTLVPGGTVTGPVDTMTTVSGETFRQCLELLAADDDVHALVALIVPTGATGDLVAAVREADVPIPFAAVVLNQPESVQLLPRSGAGQIPAYGYPEAAVGALARAAGYGAWRAGPRGRVPDFADIAAADARALVRELVRSGPAWLTPEQSADVLRCYGILLAGRPPAGPEVSITLAQDPVFGSVLMMGTAPAGQAARLTPLTDTDADHLIRCVFPGGRPPQTPPRTGGLPAPPYPPGPPRTGGLPAPPYPPGGLRDLLLRVSRLAEDLPEVTELDLNPVIAAPDGAVVVNARVKVAPYQPQDPFLRRLR